MQLLSISVAVYVDMEAARFGAQPVCVCVCVCVGVCLLTLKETPAGFLDSRLGHSQPHDRIGALLRCPQTLLHRAVEVRHRIRYG